DLERKRNTTKTASDRPKTIFPTLPFTKNKAPTANPFAAQGTDPAKATATPRIIIEEEGNTPRSPGIPGSMPKAATARPAGRLTPLPPLGAHNANASQPLSPGLSILTPPTGRPQSLPRSAASLAPPAAHLTAPPLTSPHAPRTAADSTRQQSDAMLLDARKALGHGDVRRSQHLAQQARSLGLKYGFQEDSPEKVLGAIEKYGQLMAQRPQRGTTEAFRRQYSRLMMEQAEALLTWKGFDDAERLAHQAVDQRVNYSPFEATPQKLL
ncbi:unnamed protein product, partial [marine sediment metagenome]